MTTVTALRAFKTCEEAEKFRLSLLHPDNYGLYVIYHSASNQLAVVLPKVALDVISNGNVEPPTKEWQGLTDDEIFDIADRTYGYDEIAFAHELEAKIKEKNT